MKVWGVYELSDGYEYVTENLVCICESLSKAEQVKEELDKKVISENELWTIVPENIWKEWTSHLTENNTWEYDDEYQGYTLDEYKQQEERWTTFVKKYLPAEIREYRVI